MKCPLCFTEFKTNQALSAHKFSAHEREVARKPIIHGTTQGYQAHRRAKEAPCSDCRKAWREYFTQKRSSSGN